MFYSAVVSGPIDAHKNKKYSKHCTIINFKESNICLHVSVYHHIFFLPFKHVLIGTTIKKKKIPPFTFECHVNIAISIEITEHKQSKVICMNFQCIKNST